MPAGVRVLTQDATTIALETLGLPITNTALMGAFAAATGLVSFETLAAPSGTASEALAEKNIETARRAFDEMKAKAEAS